MELVRAQVRVRVRVRVVAGGTLSLLGTDMPDYDHPINAQAYLGRHLLPLPIKWLLQRVPLPSLSYGIEGVGTCHPCITPQGVRGHPLQDV